MGCPIRGVILDPIVAMQMGVQGQVLFRCIVVLYYSILSCCGSMLFLTTYGTEYITGLSCVFCRLEPNSGIKRWRVRLLRDDLVVAHLIGDY